jgi:hypothetical protein
MTFLKLGQTYLNLDAVTRIRDVSTRDDAGTIIQGMFRVEFAGGKEVEIATDAETLRGWIESNLVALPPTGP